MSGERRRQPACTYGRRHAAQRRRGMQRYGRARCPVRRSLACASCMGGRCAARGRAWGPGAAPAGYATRPRAWRRCSRKPLPSPLQDLYAKAVAYADDLKAKIAKKDEL